MAAANAATEVGSALDADRAGGVGGVGGVGVGGRVAHAATVSITAALAAFDAVILQAPYQNPFTALPCGTAAWAARNHANAAVPMSRRSPLRDPS